VIGVDLRALAARIVERRIARVRWLASRGEVPFKVALPAIGRTRGRFAVVHRDAAGAWRISWFDARGAVGHSMVSNYCDDALARLQREESVDLDTVTEVLS
jgi:hypothetical protein